MDTVLDFRAFDARFKSGLLFSITEGLLQGKEIKIKGSLAFAVIGDEPTVTGLLLSGIGERHPKYGTNFL